MPAQIKNDNKKHGAICSALSENLFYSELSLFVDLLLVDVLSLGSLSLGALSFSSFSDFLVLDVSPEGDL